MRINSSYFHEKLTKLTKNISNISSSEIIRILIAVSICGALGGFIPEILGLGGETITGILNDSYSITFIITILFLKLFVTVICLSMGFFGGVFSPALVLGAAVERVFTYAGHYFTLGAFGDALVLRVWLLFPLLLLAHP